MFRWKTWMAFPNHSLLHSIFSEWLWTPRSSSRKTQNHSLVILRPESESIRTRYNGHIPLQSVLTELGLFLLLQTSVFLPIIYGNYFSMRWELWCRRVSYRSDAPIHTEEPGVEFCLCLLAGSLAFSLFY